MIRRFVIVVVIASSVGCVNLDRPAQVVDCGKHGGCVNGGADAAIPGSVDPDAGTDAPSLPGDDASDGGTSIQDLRAPSDVVPGACSVGGLPMPAGTVCRAAIDLCDEAEVCDGVSLDCPADKVAAASTPCRAAAGECDIAETCDGTSTGCPPDGFKAAGTVCRPAAGVCDVVESCDGISAACPADSLSPASTQCRPSTDQERCDPSENCSGTSALCPADLNYKKPAAPTGAKASAGTLSATLSWTASPNATGYDVKQSTTHGGGYTTLVSSPTTVAPPFTNTGLVGGTTYYYVISAINTIPSCESDNSSEVSATPTGTCVAPAAPVLSASASNGSVTISWAAVTGAVSYTVARSQTSGSGYVTVGTVRTGTTFSDGNVLNGVTYYYVATASNGTCSSGNSNQVSSMPACTAPAAPAGLSVTAGDGSVTLTWSASPGALSYSIYRSSTATGPFAFVNSTTKLTFTDSNVTNGSAYYYVVRTSNGSCASGDSAIVAATPACIPPAPPTGIVVTPSDKTLTLAWSAAAGATQYRVSRSTTGSGGFAQIGAPTTTNYTDATLVDGTTYYYVVAAGNGSCWSADSAVAQGTPVCVPPPVPGALVATPGDGQVSLSWGASAGATVYTIWRKTGATGTYAKIGSSTTTTYLDSAASDGTTYVYKISAGNGSCDSDFDAEQTATPVAACAQNAPANVKATASGSVQVTLTWQAASPTPTSYGIARSASSGTGFASIGSVGGNVLSFTDTDTALVKNTTYYYQVTANGSCSATAAQVSATTACANPSAPAAPTVANASGALTVTWAAVPGATAYTVYRSTSATGGYAAVSTNQTAATYSDTSLDNGTTYYYEVSASNANAQCSSAPSGAGSATTCKPLDAPTGLARSVGTSGTVVLTWTAVSGAASYIVMRGSASGGPFTSVGTSTDTSFTNTGLTDDTSYYYVVASVAGSAGTCASANSTALLAIPRACQVLAASVNGYTLSTTGAGCFVTCNDAKWGWGCSSFDTTNRTMTVNGQAVTCGGTLPSQANGAFTFKIGATNTNHTWDALWWSGTSNACP